MGESDDNTKGTEPKGDGSIDGVNEKKTSPPDVGGDTDSGEKKT